MQTAAAASGKEEEKEEKEEEESCGLSETLRPMRMYDTLCLDYHPCFPKNIF